MSDINVALSYLSSAYENQSECSTVTRVAVATAAKVKGSALPNVQGETKVKGERKSRAKVETVKAMASSARPAGLPFLPVGTYDGAGFLRAWRMAKSRDEQIQALQGYQGFEPGTPIGVQEFKANLSARRETRGPIDISGPSREDIRREKLSRPGYVQGIPNGPARLAGNLAARQNMLTEQVSKLESLIMDPSMTNEEKLVETARIVAGPADIDKDGKEVPRTFRPMDPHATLASVRKVLSSLNETLDMAE